MENLELTFRFDDEVNPLTKHIGLPIDIFAQFLSSLAEAMNIKQSKDLVVSEIKGNCYAPVISTSSITKYNELKTLHDQISKNEYGNLNHKQKQYARTLKALLGSTLSLNVYDLNKEFYKTISEITIQNKHPFYYESTSVRGTVTRIGGRFIDSKTKINISNYEHDIEINSQQDENLKEYYKKGILEFYITQKINSEKKNVEYAVLDDFIFLYSTIDGDRTFSQSLINIREKHGEYFTQIINMLENE